MEKPPTWLCDYQRDVYSQAGEDGIIEEILRLIPNHDLWCVEFGAWDGMHYSNSRNLIENKSYSAVLIEGSKKRFTELQGNYSHCSTVYPVNAFVGFDPNDNLDTLLKKTPIPHDFDFLSIDIDGNDYHVWKAMSLYRPKALVIEFNPTIPSHIEFVQPADPSVSKGSSLLSLIKLGKEKGYELVSVLSFNAFFVKQEYYSLFDLSSNNIDVLQTDKRLITYLFSTYDGQIYLDGGCLLPWHETPIRPEHMQYLPKILRSETGGNYAFWRKIIFSIWLLREDPKRLMREIKKICDRVFKQGVD
ncbi:MAG: hypothetical protein WCJ02_02200 [bacterium]